MNYWASGLLYGDLETANRVVSDHLTAKMVKKGLTPQGISGLSRLPLADVTRLVQEGKGSVSCFSRVTISLGVMLDDLIDVAKLPEDKWGEVDSMMSASDAGKKFGTGGDQVHPAKRKELQAYVALRIVDEIAHASQVI